MNTRARGWLVQIAAVLLLATAGLASGSGVNLGENSCRGQNVEEGVVHRGSASVSGELHQGYADARLQDAAGLFVAPNGLSSMSNMNRTAGRLYDQNRIDALRRYLDRNNVDLILNSTENKFVANSVGRHQLHLRPDPTFYEVYHELQHYRHLRGVGYARFSRTSEALREQYVYDQLRLSTNLWQNVLNQAERDNAFLYILLKNGNPMSTPVRGFP